MLTTNNDRNNSEDKFVNMGFAIVLLVFLILLLEISVIIFTTYLKTKVIFSKKTQEKQNQDFLP